MWREAKQKRWEEEERRERKRRREKREEKRVEEEKERERETERRDREERETERDRERKRRGRRRREQQRKAEAQKGEMFVALLSSSHPIINMRFDFRTECGIFLKRNKIHDIWKGRTKPNYINWIRWSFGIEITNKPSINTQKINYINLHNRKRYKESCYLPNLRWSTNESTVLRSMQWKIKWVCLCSFSTSPNAHSPVWKNISKLDLHEDHLCRKKNDSYSSDKMFFSLRLPFPCWNSNEVSRIGLPHLLGKRVTPFLEPMQ